jgi:hypothetical protein
MVLRVDRGTDPCKENWRQIPGAKDLLGHPRVSLRKKLIELRELVVVIAAKPCNLVHGDEDMEKKIYYFEDWKPENTEITFQLVRERLTGSAIKNLVIASTTGATARKAAEFFKDAGVKLAALAYILRFKKLSI